MGEVSVELALVLFAGPSEGVPLEGDTDLFPLEALGTEVPLAERGVFPPSSSQTDRGSAS
ncbi:UNVERIFIED_CONTAM: hypothetical protein Sradi_3261000 [Sesamum radiatum]|uniref:Secreted protein n=1 Tax=Sesamum radiatum TaxID=300843 RepID=A0AAW2R027_SESRA